LLFRRFGLLCGDGLRPDTLAAGLRHRLAGAVRVNDDRPGLVGGSIGASHLVPHWKASAGATPMRSAAVPSYTDKTADGSYTKQRRQQCNAQAQESEGILRIPEYHKRKPQRIEENGSRQ